MATNKTDRSPGPAWDDEQLLEWILNPDGAARASDGSVPRIPAAVDPATGDPATGDPATGDPATVARMGELAEFLSDCRSALDDELLLDGVRAEAQERDAALAARVFARTTREDLSWRGDLTLVGGYVRERLSRSVLLRFAAASLLLHVAALPVLAYYAFLAPTPPSIIIDTIPWGEQYPAEPFPEDRAEPEFPLEVDLDEEPAVREQPGESEDERW